MPSSTSWVWDHFQKCEDPKETAKCNIWEKHYQCKSSSTSGLARHLKNVHRIRDESNEGSTNASAAEKSSERPIEPKKPTRKRLRQEEEQKDRELANIEEDVARMMALDGFSANQISRSSFIRDAFARKGNCV